MWHGRRPPPILDPPRSRIECTFRTGSPLAIDLYARRAQRIEQIVRATSRLPSLAGSLMGPTTDYMPRWRRTSDGDIEKWEFPIRMPLPFRPGDPVPHCQGRASNGNPSYDFGAVAGRYVVLAFLGAASQEPVRQAMAMVMQYRDLFDDRHASFFGISVDPADETSGHLRETLPGIRFFWDHDQAISRRFGALQDAADGETPVYQACWLVLDPMLRVLAGAPLAEAERVLRLIAGLPPVDTHAGCELQAPVLILPRIFEPDFCRRLIELYRRHGGRDSGFMREVDGKTVAALDHGFKRRSDHHIEDETVQRAIRARILRRLVPAIEQAFQFRVTRMERYLVACYEAEHGGHFRAHRDNTTRGTAHRRFAVTINLNAEEFQGGELRFPEFGPRTYRAPTGGGVVFSCSLLHEALPVSAGRRFAFLPFLYDEAAARLRVANNQYLGEGVGAYRLGGALSGGS